jgi:hypothetical protein
MDLTTQRQKLLMGIASVSPAPAPARIDDVEAWKVDEFAEVTKISRTVIYDAINPERAAAKGLPLLPSLKIGRSRRIRPEAGRSWLRELERRTA